MLYQRVLSFYEPDRCVNRSSLLYFTQRNASKLLRGPCSVELYIATESDVDHERAWNWIQELYKFTVSGVSGSLNKYYSESSLVT